MIVSRNPADPADEVGRSRPPRRPPSTRRWSARSAGVDLHAPFGGTKASSFGSREQGRAARDFFTETRTISISL